MMVTNSRFSPTQIDFSQLADLPIRFEQGQQIARERDLRDAFSGGIPRGPNGEEDWGAAIALLAQFDPVAGLKIAADRAGAEAMANYRMQSLLPTDLRPYAGGGGIPEAAPDGVGQPTNITPPVIGSGTAPGGPYASAPSGQPPAPSVRKPPAAVDKYFRTTEEIEADKKRGANVVEEGKKVEGKERLSENLTQLTQSYVKLKEAGAFIDPSRSWGENLEAWARTSGAGQVFGGMVGSTTQAIVDRINNMRPALINAIRQATGMSAKAMDSNTELQFYLQQATDPNASIASNFAAIDALDKAYGLGGALDKILPPELLQTIRSGSPTIEPPQATESPQQDQEMPRDRFGAPQPDPAHVNALKSALSQHPPEDHEEIISEWERTFPQYGAGAGYHFLGIEGR